VCQIEHHIGRVELKPNSFSGPVLEASETFEAGFTRSFVGRYFRSVEIDLAVFVVESKIIYPNYTWFF
jgi:hypothetical protein